MLVTALVAMRLQRSGMDWWSSQKANLAQQKKQLHALPVLHLTSWHLAQLCSQETCWGTSTHCNIERMAHPRLFSSLDVRRSPPAGGGQASDSEFWMIKRACSSVLSAGCSMTCRARARFARGHRKPSSTHRANRGTCSTHRPHQHFMFCFTLPQESCKRLNWEHAHRQASGRALIRGHLEPSPTPLDQGATRQCCSC